MVSRVKRRKSKETRKLSEKRYEKHRRHNLLYAEPGINDFVIVLDHLKPQFNIAKIYRSAEAFGAKAVHLIGTQYFDTKAAKGSFKWVPTEFHTTFESCYSRLADDEYVLHVLDPVAENSLHSIVLPAKSAFIFGHEEFGFSFDRTVYKRIRSVKIEQVGRVDSLNVCVAASINHVRILSAACAERVSAASPAQPIVVLVAASDSDSWMDVRGACHIKNSLAVSLLFLIPVCTVTITDY